jgi:hypothetical protein
MLAILLCLPALAAAQSPAPPPPEPSPGPPAPRSDEFDWVQLNNGEWLKGEIKDLQDDKFVFESDEMDTLDFDWEDVHAVYSSKQNTLMFKDKTVVEGKVRIEGERVVVENDEGEQVFDRTQLRSLIPGRRTELNFWSGKLSFGATVRRGNVDQTDASWLFQLQRRDEDSRLWLEYTGAYGSVEGDKTEDNHRVLSFYDVYLTERFYLRPVAFSGLRDEFQNIRWRLTPSAGVGYDVIDESRIDWSISAGLGWEFTKFFDAEPGEPSHEDTAALLFGSRFEWEATKKVDLGIEFNLTMPMPEQSDYSFRAVLWTEVDVWGDLDLDVRLTWDRFNDPSKSSDGTQPDADDFRLYVGVGWEF